MLTQILHEIETAQGPITVRELSRKLEIDPQALEGMLEFWVCKGRIQNDDKVATCNSGTGTCGSTCSGSKNCTFIAKMPKTYSLPGMNASRNLDESR
jgi:hypothetical protein